MKMSLCTGRKFSEFQVDVLDFHNDFRSRHGSPALILNEKLCKYAEDHAKFLSQCDKQRSSKSPFGENIFIKSGKRKIYTDALEPVNEWYSEVKNFDGETAYPSKDIKHFAQVVWKATKWIGVGRAFNE